MRAIKVSSLHNAESRHLIPLNAWHQPTGGREELRCLLLQLRETAEQACHAVVHQLSRWGRRVIAANGCAWRDRLQEAATPSSWHRIWFLVALLNPLWSQRLPRISTSSVSIVYSMSVSYNITVIKIVRTPQFLNFFQAQEAVEEYPWNTLVKFQVCPSDFRRKSQSMHPALVAVEDPSLDLSVRLSS